MAASAFQSGGGEASGSSNGSSSHRRSRSLSLSSGRFPPPPPPPEPDEFVTPRGRFVNKVRGSRFPEISVEDLADEFFRARIQSNDESEPSSAARSSRRRSDAMYWMDSDSSRRRGRSVSRAPDWGASQPKGFFESSDSRRRRSISTARHRRINLEDDTDCHNSSIKILKIKQQLSHNPSINRHLSRRSKSLKDLFHCRDNYMVTHDERDAHFSRCGVERTFQAVYAQEKEEQSTTDGEHVDHESRRKEVTLADEDIIMILEKIMSMAEPVSTPSSIAPPKSSHFVQAIAQIRRRYTEKLEKSEKRKQDLLAELAMEEERGQELSTIVKELLPSPRRSIARERHLSSKRSSNDRTRICKRLTEEAERYFEDLLSNAEDTDISSLDGERSVTSLSFKDQGPHSFTNGTHESMVASVPSDTDDILLPWLQWEISANPSPSCKNKVTRHEMQGTMGGSSNAGEASPEKRSHQGNGSTFVSRYMDRSYYTKVRRSKTKNTVGCGSSSFDMEEYSMLRHREEDLLIEMLKQRQGIYPGSLILCGKCLP